MAKLTINKKYLGKTVHTAKKVGKDKVETVSIALDEKTSQEDLQWLKDVKNHPCVD